MTTIRQFCVAQQYHDIGYAHGDTPITPARTASGLSTVTARLAHPLYNKVTLHSHPSLLQEVGTVLAEAIDLDSAIPPLLENNHLWVNDRVSGRLFADEPQTYPSYDRAYGSPISKILQTASAIQSRGDELLGRDWQLTPSTVKVGRGDFTLYSTALEPAGLLEIKRRDKLPDSYMRYLSSDMDGSYAIYKPNQSSLDQGNYKLKDCTVPTTYHQTLEKIVQQLLFEVTQSTASVVVLSTWHYFMAAKLDGATLSFSPLVCRDFNVPLDASAQDLIQTPFGFMLGISCLPVVVRDEDARLRQLEESKARIRGPRGASKGARESGAVTRSRQSAIDRNSDYQLAPIGEESASRPATRTALVLHLSNGAAPISFACHPFTTDQFHSFYRNPRDCAAECRLGAERGQGRVWRSFSAVLEKGKLSEATLTQTFPLTPPLTPPPSPPCKIIIKVTSTELSLEEMSAAVASEILALKSITEKNLHVAPDMLGLYEGKVAGQTRCCMLMSDGGYSIYFKDLKAHEKQQIRELYQRLHAGGMTHGDPHWRHWLWSGQRCTIIDFDRASFEEQRRPPEYESFADLCESEMAAVNAWLAGCDLDV